MSHDIASNDAEPGLAPRLDTVEIRLTELQVMLDDLNTVVLDQWKQIAELKALVERLEGQLADAAVDGGLAAQDEPPPPHY